MRGEILSALPPLLLPAGTASAEDKEPFAVLEVGSAGEWDLNGDGSGFGPAAAIEFTAIKNRLAIEPGVTTLFGRRQTEWDTGFVFRKPFDLLPLWSLNPASGRYGFIQQATVGQSTPSALRPRLTSRFGRRRIENVVGS